MNSAQNCLRCFYYLSLIIIRNQILWQSKRSILTGIKSYHCNTTELVIPFVYIVFMKKPNTNIHHEMLGSSYYQFLNNLMLGNGTNKKIWNYIYFLKTYSFWFTATIVNDISLNFLAKTNVSLLLNVYQLMYLI